MGIPSIPFYISGKLSLKPSFSLYEGDPVLLKSGIQAAIPNPGPVFLKAIDNALQRDGAGKRRGKRSDLPGNKGEQTVREYPSFGHFRFKTPRSSQPDTEFPFQVQKTVKSNSTGSARKERFFRSISPSEPSENPEKVSSSVEISFRTAF